MVPQPQRKRCKSHCAMHDQLRRTVRSLSDEHANPSESGARISYAGSRSKRDREESNGSTSSGQIPPSYPRPGSRYNAWRDHRRRGRHGKATADRGLDAACTPKPFLRGLPSIFVLRATDGNDTATTRRRTRRCCFAEINHQPMSVGLDDE
jgi:hypothetical protein